MHPDKPPTPLTATDPPPVKQPLEPADLPEKPPPPPPPHPHLAPAPESAPLSA